MEVKLEAIKFNHNLGSATNDAFSIRRNESLPVPPPEWRPTVNEAKDSPAAYASAGRRFEPCSAHHYFQ